MITTPITIPVITTSVAYLSNIFSKLFLLLWCSSSEALPLITTSSLTGELLGCAVVANVSVDSVVISWVGNLDGYTVGSVVGPFEGWAVTDVGKLVGLIEGWLGIRVGTAVGAEEGAFVGIYVAFSQPKEGGSKKKVVILSQ